MIALATGLGDPLVGSYAWCFASLDATAHWHAAEYIEDYLAGYSRSHPNIVLVVGRSKDQKYERAACVRVVAS